MLLDVLKSGGLQQAPHRPGLIIAMFAKQPALW